MNIPFYNKHPLACLGKFYRDEDISEQVYCSVHIKAGEHTFSRYMTPQGWSRSVFYFANQKDAEQTFNLHGQSEPQPVDQFEIDNRESERAHYLEMQEQEFESQMRALS